MTATSSRPITAESSPSDWMRAWMVAADPVCRSITGDGVRRTLDLVEEALPPGVRRSETYRNLSPYGEPQLGNRGLYPATGGKVASDEVLAMLWTLALSDGKTSLDQVAEHAELRFGDIVRAAAKLTSAGLLATVPADPAGLSRGRGRRSHG